MLCCLVSQRCVQVHLVTTVARFVLGVGVGGKCPLTAVSRQESSGPDKHAGTEVAKAFIWQVPITPPPITMSSPGPVPSYPSLETALMVRTLMVGKCHAQTHNHRQASTPDHPPTPFKLLLSYWAFSCFLVSCATMAASVPCSQPCLTS